MVEKKKAGAKRTTAAATTKSTKARAAVKSKPAAKAKSGVAKSKTAAKTTAKTATKSTVKASTKAAVAKSSSARRASLPPPPSDANSRRRDEAKKIAIAVAVAALDKKAERVEIVDIGEKVDYADYLVVMTGRSDRQVLAIASGIEESVKKSAGIRTRGREGLPAGHWVLMDLGDVIVHIFLDEARKYYDLEGLWMDAPRVPTPAFVPQGAPGIPSE